MMNCPGLCLRATRGASITNCLILRPAVLASKILNIKGVSNFAEAACNSLWRGDQKRPRTVSICAPRRGRTNRRLTAWSTMRDGGCDASHHGGHILWAVLCLDHACATTVLHGFPPLPSPVHARLRLPSQGE